jgi:MFS family permease
LSNELLGLKRYGTFMGIMNAAVSVGLVIGPVVAGRIFDVTRSYTGEFEVAALVSIITAIKIQRCPVAGPELPAASKISRVLESVPDPGSPVGWPWEAVDPIKGASLHFRRVV